MKQSLLAVLTALVASVPAAIIPSTDQVVLTPSASELFLVETAPDRQQWITEEQKWELRREGINFIDITETQDLGRDASTSAVVKFPEHVAFNKTVRPMLKELNKANMRSHLEIFTAFHTRFYKSDYGKQSAHWLLEQVGETVRASGAYEYGASVKAFSHPWGQPSIIAQIPGKSNKTIVIGAHQDSINLFLPWVFAAPGADDDGSGTVTILEALRVLLQSDKIVQGNASNTIEFHWYSAEEGGLLGSQAVFLSYQQEKRDVKAMLQQDMTGYVQATLDAGLPESVGVITDYVDPGLTEFIKEVITEYCDIPFVLTKCGYACSDHASASKAGYPSAFVIESDFQHSETNRIHTGEDKIEFLSFDHMLQHARLTLSLAYELAFANFD